MTAENRISLERKGALAVIRLNRPEARNGWDEFTSRPSAWRRCGNPMTGV